MYTNDIDTLRQLISQSIPQVINSEKYDKNYYNRLSKHMDDITEEEADCMIETINKFYKVMSERRVDIE